MNHFFSEPANCRVFVCESSTPVRKVIVDAMRSVGYQHLNSSANPKDLLEVIEVEPVDWIITSLEPNETINGLHILKLITEVPRFRQTRASLMLRPGEEYVLPLAFEMGLLSYHDRSLPMTFAEEFKRLRTHLEHSKWNTTITSAAYLRRYLRENRQYKRLLAFEKSLLDLFPGSCDILLNIAEASFLGGEHEQALATLRQISLLGANYEEKAQELCRQYVQESNGCDPFDLTVAEPAKSSDNPLGSAINALGIEKCLVVDPDTSIQYSLEKCLREAGVPQVVVFSCGEQAWRWIQSGERPDLIIQEWRLPSLTGPMFLQRVRKQGLISVPILVISSLIKEDDVSLVLEMGVSAVVEKPFEHTTILKEVVWTLQQNKMPTEQLSLERKIKQLLELGNGAEAKRLQGQYLANGDFDKAGKLGILAEFAFYDGKFEKARDLAFQALKMSRDSLPTLNLLGKALLKLGDHAGALKCFAKAQSLSPKHVERLCQIATIELDSGNTSAAEEVLANAKSLDPDNVAVRETEANVALATNDVDRAREALGQLESLSRILSYMNNKAVAMTRCGQFEDGIELYKSTLKALPGDWGHTHDVVLYNLGLAYVRYSELENAMAELERIRSDSKSPLGIKAASLKSRIQQAIKTGKGMVLSEAAPAPPPAPSVDGEKPDPQEEAIDFDKLIGSIEAGRGDICCYRIFFANELLQPDAIALVRHPPRFKERQSIERDESLQIKPGA
jgi:CheY-like chemotaxis protein